MPIYSFVAYAPGTLTISGGTVTLDPSFDKTTDTVTISVNDDDSLFDGDLGANETGDDANQTNNGSGIQMYGEERYILSNGTEITLVEEAGVVQGYLVQGTPLTPGVSYTIAGTQNITPSNQDDYSAFNSIIVCFAAGTWIDTRDGPIAVEHVEEGTLLRTLDNGFQPVRAVTMQTVKACGAHAPIRIAPGAFPVTEPLMLSQQHRVFICDPVLALYTGSEEMLCAAKHLTRLPGVTRSDASHQITYCHLLMGRHEIIRANGLWTESLFSTEVSGPLPDGFRHHRRTARPCLKSYEAKLLRRGTPLAPRPVRRSRSLSLSLAEAR